MRAIELNRGFDERCEPEDKKNEGAEEDDAWNEDTVCGKYEDEQNEDEG